jgi:hypothetical protein
MAKLDILSLFEVFDELPKLCERNSTTLIYRSTKFDVLIPQKKHTIAI